MKPVEDPALLAELEGKPRKAVADPALLAMLEGPSDTAVAVNSAKKAVAGIPDMLLNTPQNVINLGKAAFGMGAHALGRPDMAPEITDEAPNYVTNAARKAGVITNADPQNAKQRIIDAIVQGGVSGAINPAQGAKQLAANIGVSALGGGAAGATQEATGSAEAGIVAALLTPGVVNSAANRARGRVSEKALEQSANEVRDASLAQGREAGYVTPPADVVADGMKGFVNKRLTSIAGKAATNQDATLKNQRITNESAAAELGFPRGTAITESKLEAYRNTTAEPYREVAALSPVAASALERLKAARQEAKLQNRHYDVSADPKALKAAQKAEADAETLETALEKIAAKSGKPGLIDELRDARRQIAKSYDIERSLNLGSADVSASILGGMLDKGKKLSGNLETTAKFQQSFPRSMGDGSKTPAAGVSKLEAVTAALMAGGGYGMFGPEGLAAGALPLASGVARKGILSKPYQNLMATPDYSPGMIDRAMSSLPKNTDQEAALQALLLARAIAERQGVN
jgi:hypothetical protein